MLVSFFDAKLLTFYLVTKKITDCITANPFNPSASAKMVAWWAYTISRCKNCDIESKLASKVSDNDLCAACEILQQCAGNNEKSQRAIERTHYLHEMKPLLNRKVEKTVNGNRLNIGFTKEGNKHLFADTFGRTHIVTKEDLKDLATYLENAEFIDDSALTHSRNDNIEHFYYFKTQINGRWVRLNVAKKVEIRRDNGATRIEYILYSVNDIIE